MNLIFLIILASLFYAASELMYKFTNCSKIQSDLYVSILWIMGGIISIIYFFGRGFYKEKVKFDILIKIFLIALTIFPASLLYWTACKKHSNPGYLRGSETAFRILILTIISLIILKNGINIYKIAGIACIILGVYLVNM